MRETNENYTSDQKGLKEEYYTLCTEHAALGYINF